MLRPSTPWRRFWFVCAVAIVALLALVLHSFLGTLVFGVFLYYSSRPIYDRLRSVVRPPTLAAVAALTVLVLPVILLFWYIAALALGELSTLADVDLAPYRDLLSPYIDFGGSSSDIGALFQSILADPGQIMEGGGVRDVVMQLASTAGQFLVSALTSLFHLFIALTVAFYLLRDDQKLVGWVRDNFEDGTLEEFGQAVDADLQTVFFGNILNAVLTAVIGTTVFYALAAVAPPAVPVPVPILLGLLTGIASLVPIVGMRIVTVPTTLYLGALAATTDPNLLWFPALFFVVSLVFVESIPDLVLRPYISGRNLHVGLVMMAYIFGPLLFGWYGLFLGPLLLVVVVHFAGIVVPELARSFNETGPRPTESADALLGRTGRGPAASKSPARDDVESILGADTPVRSEDEPAWDPTPDDE